MFSQPILQFGKGRCARLFQGSGCESTHPAIADTQRRSNIPVLADMIFDGLSGLFDALFYTQGVDTIVISMAL